MDSPPPGMDEAIAISKARIFPCLQFLVLLFCRIIYFSLLCLLSYKFPEIFRIIFVLAAASQVMQFVESQEYNMFTRIVFDTAPTVSENSIPLKIIEIAINFSILLTKLVIGPYP